MYLRKKDKKTIDELRLKFQKFTRKEFRNN